MKGRAGYQAARAGQQTVERNGGTAAGSATRATTPAVAGTPSKSAPRGSFDPAPGLTFVRFFTDTGAGRVDPFDEVEWELRSAVIGNERGEVVFEQRDVEIPKFWSQ